MNPEEKDNLLARWLNDELSEEEKKSLRKDGDEEILRSIINTVDEWSLPELKTETFQKIQQRISDKPHEAKVVPLYKKTWFVAMAASLVLVVALVWFLIPGTGSSGGGMTELACSAGQTKTFTLEDNTNITLYGNSKVIYDKATYSKDRKLNLEGEGYFEVNQKGAFEVDYKDGKVTVLGTKFNILSTSEIATVKCYEGKVQVEMSEEQVQLTAGEGIRKKAAEKIVKYTFENAEGKKIEGAEIFESAPLGEVISSLSLYYNVEIIPENVDLDRNFTGRFSQSSLDSALTMVFDPMGIAFTKEGQKIHLKNK